MFITIFADVKPVGISLKTIIMKMPPQRRNKILIGAAIGASLGIGIAIASKRGTGGKIIFTTLGVVLGGGVGLFASAT